MINIPPIKPSAEIKTELLPNITQTWKIGRVLNATVETGGEALQKILLRIGQQQLEARTPVALKTGDQVQLLVKSLGDTPLLSIQGGVDKAARAAEQLRKVIGQQQQAAQFASLVQRLAADPRLPAELQTRLQNLVRQLPDAAQLGQPQQLKNLVRDSGLLLESRLLRQATAGAGESAPLQRDLKAQLLKISASLPELPARMPAAITEPADDAVPTLDRAIRAFTGGSISLGQLANQLLVSLKPAQLQTLQDFLSGKQTALPADLAIKLPGLLQHLNTRAQPKQLMENLFSLLRNLPVLQELKTAVDSALARITSQQLLPMTRDADSPLLLLFDLPVRDKERLQLFQFRIEEEKRGADHDKGSWTVTINFDLQPMGPVQARLHLMDQRIATVFHAQNSRSVDLIRQHLPLLESAYVRAGLQVAQIDVIVGKAEPIQQVEHSVRILDEQA